MHSSPANKSIRLAVLLDATTISGSAKVVIQNMSALPSGIEAVVILIKRKGATAAEIEGEFNKLGIDFKFVEESFLFDPRALIKVIKFLATKKFEVLESNHYKTHFIALIASKFLNLPWVAVSHGWTSEGLRMKLYNMLDCITLPFSTVCVAMGPSIATKLNKFLPDSMRVRCWMTAFDTAQLGSPKSETDLRKELAIDKSEFVFGAVGRLSYEKGFDLLINAVKLIGESDIPFRVLIVGEGPEMHSLLESLQNNGLEGKIVFLGRKTNDQMAAFYQSIDCLVISSRSEGLPNVLLEAAWFERPVISSDVGGIPILMNSKLAAWLVKGGSAESLASTMVRMLQLSLEQRGVLARLFKSRLREDFLADKRTKKVFRLYRALFRMHSKRSKIPPGI